MDENVHFVHRKGGKIVLYEGFQYTKYKKYTNNDVRWICCNKKKFKCSGAVTMRGHQIIKLTKHNSMNARCLPDQARNEIAVTLDKIKTKAGTCPEQPVKKVFDDMMRPLYDQGLHMLTPIPSYVSSKNAIYTKRKSELDVKKLMFNEITEVEIPKKYRQYILGDYIMNKRRIIVFCNEEGKRLLSSRKEFFGDATFKSTPRPFAQLFALHAELESTSDATNIVPVLYALMSDKTEESYCILYEIIKTNVPDWQPNIIHADFEMGLTNPLKALFPNLIVKRCYYHFTNSLWKKAKKLNIKSRLHKRIVGLCAVLPLLPLEKVGEGYSYIKDQTKELGDTKNIKLFLRYMEKTWLQNEKIIAEWCIYNERHRTNNFAEAWNSKLNRQINKKYVTLSKLLTVLENDMSLNKMVITNFENNVASSKRRKVYTERDSFILNAQMQMVHNDISVGHFMEKMR